jgi:PAS domain S-box-containing protein
MSDKPVQTFLCSLRTRLVGLVLLAVLLALGLILYTATEQRREAAIATQENLLRLTKLTAANQKQVTDGTRQLLTTLARLPEVRGGNRADCTRLLADIQKQSPHYVGFGVSDLNGNLWCSSLPFTQPVNISDRLFFRLVRETKQFAIGDYQIGKLSRRATIAFGYPILDKTGQLQAVLSAGLDLERINQLTLVPQLPEGATLTVVDRNSTVLLRYPDLQQWLGKSAPEMEINQIVLAQAEGMAEARGLDGTERLFAFTRLGDDPVNGAISIRIGVPKSIAFANANRLLAQNLANLGLVTLLALAAAWFFGDVFLVRKVKSLLNTTQKLRQGDLTARTTLATDAGELGQLARSVDEMAAALEQSQATVSQSEARSQLALTVGRMGTWDWNLHTNTLIWSEGHFILLGLDPHECEASYELWARHLHPDDRAAVEAAFEQAKTQRNEYRAEYRIIQQNGAIVWVEGRGQFYLDADGQPYRMIGVVVDISDRKQAETDLRNSETRYRLLAEAIPQFVWITNAAGQNEYVNQRFCDYTGLSAKQMSGLEWLSIIHPDDLEMTRQCWLAAVSNGGFYEIEYRFRRADGVYRWFLGQGIPLRDEQGQISQWFGTCTDIEPQKQIEQARSHLLEREQTAREAAESANRIKDEFLAVLSHELRTPMNPILGWSKLLRSGKLDSTKAARALETIDRNAQLQVQLIDDLLDISRILQGKLRLNSEPVSLNSVITAAIETVRLAAEAKAIALQPIFPLAAPVVNGDAGRLQQVVWNLLSNAVKFTPVGGRVEVKLESFEFSVLSSELSDSIQNSKARSAADANNTQNSPKLLDVTLDVTQNSKLNTQNSYAQITITDTGKGIAPDFLPYVFEHFRQEDGATTRKFGGLGLGLAIARQIIELHGGQISVESPGEAQGATFIVQIPLAASPQISTSEAATASATNLDGLQILVVDDEPDSREFVAFVLEQAGAIVTSLSSGIEALQKLEQFVFDLVVSDIGMPEMDGYMLMQQLRLLKQHRQIPVIALTAYAGEVDQQQAIAAGFQQHLSKPVEPEALVSAIVDLLSTSG